MNSTTQYRKHKYRLWFQIQIDLISKENHSGKNGEGHAGLGKGSSLVFSRIGLAGTRGKKTGVENNNVLIILMKTRSNININIGMCLKCLITHLSAIQRKNKKGWIK